MNKIEIPSAPAVPRNDEQKKINWQDSLSIQHLLNVISSILAEEYIATAKQNPEVFARSPLPIPTHKGERIKNGGNK
jgi:hypothetical protein